MVEPVPCSPLSAASRATEYTDKAVSPARPPKKEDAPLKKTPQAIEPIAVDNEDEMKDAIDDYLKNEELDDYLKTRDDLEQRCYDYLVSVISTEDILRKTMNLYRGHTDFVVVSKYKNEIWIRGEILPSGFKLNFFRHSKKENSELDGVYLEINDIFKEEALYRISRAMAI